MTRCLAILALILLVGCASGRPSQPTKTAVVEVFTDACNAYAASLLAAAAALQGNGLTEPQIDKIHQAKVIGDGICKGPVPTDYAAAAVNVLQLTATITQTAGAH